MADELRIEDIYRARKSREKSGQAAQWADQIAASSVAAGFKATAEAVRRLSGSGAFFPPGTRTPLNDLLVQRVTRTEKIADTPHLQALLWAPTRWTVEDHPELDFHFVERELTPGSAVSGTKRFWMIDAKYRLSADALLVNAVDRTPIVAEIKIAGDQNAEYALIQALAAAAQLSAPKQRKRLSAAYRDYFGTSVSDFSDVYIILAQRPPRGTRPRLLTRAIELSDTLLDQGDLAPWIRRICFLEAIRDKSGMRFRRLLAA